MSTEILSQDEINALMSGMLGEAAPVAELEQSGGIRDYNLASHDRIIRGRLPALEVINERFARLLRPGLFKFMRRHADVTVGPVRVMKYSEFTRNLVLPANLNLIHLNPLRGMALLVLDPNLVFLMVDSLFGGHGKFHTRVEGREFTLTEQSVIRRALEMLLAELKQAWDPVFEVNFEHVGSEMNTQFANIAAPTEVVVATTFNLELGGGGGDLHLCFPYIMLDPILPLLQASHQGEQRAPRHGVVPADLLSGPYGELTFALGAEADLGMLSVMELRSLRPGDVLPLAQDAHLAVAGMPLCAGHLLPGRRRRSLQISRLVTSSGG